MAVSIKTLIEAKYAETTETTQIPAVTVKTVIDRIVAINRTPSTTVTLTFRIIPPGSSVAATAFGAAATILPGKTYYFPELTGQCLDPGAFVSTLCTAGTAVVIRCTGREFT